MTITHATATRNAIADAVDAQVNSGSGTATLVWRDSTTELATFDLSNPAFGAASSGTITLADTPIEDSSADGTGEADNFVIEDRDGSVVFSGSITLSGGGGDIELDNTNIVSGQTCSLDSFSYSAPS